MVPWEAVKDSKTNSNKMVAALVSSEAVSAVGTSMAPHRIHKVVKVSSHRRVQVDRISREIKVASLATSKAIVLSSLPLCSSNNSRAVWAAKAVGEAGAEEEDVDSTESYSLEFPAFTAELGYATNQFYEM